MSARALPSPQWCAQRALGQAIIQLVFGRVRRAVFHEMPSLLQQHFPEHGPYLGVYARVVRGGQVEVGSQVRVAPESPIGPAATIITSATLLVAAFAVLAALAALMAPELWASFRDGMARSLSVRPG